MGGEANVLVRKLRSGGVARSPLPDTDFIGQTFARQLEKGLRPLVKTMLSATVLECKVVKVSEAIQGIAVPTMLALVELDNAKVQGLFNIDGTLAYHLIDLMLGGEPTVPATPAPRSFTEIDLALCGLAQEALLAAFAEALAACFGRPLAKPLQLVGQRQDITQVRFAPEHADVLVYDVTLEIGGAVRSGRLHVILPLAMLDTICAMLRDEAPRIRQDEPKDLWKAAMRHAAARAPVALDAVLHRRRMTLAEVMRLRIGDVLELPAAALDRVRLMIAQPGGRDAEIAAGRLGAYQGAKVVKLETPVDPRLRDSLGVLWPMPAPPPPPPEVGLLPDQSEETAPSVVSDA